MKEKILAQTENIEVAPKLKLSTVYDDLSWEEANDLQMKLNHYTFKDTGKIAPGGYSYWNLPNLQVLQKIVAEDSKSGGHHFSVGDIFWTYHVSAYKIVKDKDGILSVDPSEVPTGLNKFHEGGKRFKAFCYHVEGNGD